MLATLRVSVPTVIDEIFGRNNVERCNRRLDFWSRSLIEGARIKLHVEGREAIDAHRCYVVISNHQSLYDIPVVMQAFAKPIRMVTKTELFRVPIWGAAMKAAGFIEVNRKNRRQAIESLKATGVRMVEQGVSVWVAPEGTRSRDGKLAPFKSGGFHFAQQTGLEILPLAIAGSRAVLPADSWRVRHGLSVRATFGAPIDPRGREIPELIESVRTYIAQHLEGKQ